MLRAFAISAASFAALPAQAQIQLEVSNQYSAIHYAHVGTLEPRGDVLITLPPTSDVYTAYIKTTGGSLRVMVFDQAKVKALDAGAVVLDRPVTAEATITVPPATSLTAHVLAVLNQSARPVTLDLTLFRRGVRSDATVRAFKEWLQVPIDAVQHAYRAPSFRVSVEPCQVASAFSDASRGNVVICTELLADLVEHKRGGAVHPIVLHELAHSLLLLWGLPGYDNEDMADEFAVALMAGADPAAIEDLIGWFESQDSIGEAVVQLVNGDRHTISMQRARNMRAALKKPDDIVRRWSNMLVPFARSSSQ